MRNARNTTGYVEYGLENKIGLATSSDIKEELFSTIEYISEIESVGIKHIKELFKSRSIKNEDCKKIFKQFQSFIRQARVYYDSAEKLHHRASPLNYYYSFMNLAKAVLILNVPSYFHKTGKTKNGKTKQVKHIHGLRCKNVDFCLNNQTLIIDKGNNISRPIFKKFYEVLMKQTISPNAPLNIVNLFSYCTDITYEYEHLARMGKTKSLPGMFRVNVDKTRKMAWAMLAIAFFNDRMSTYGNFLKKFNDYFEEVKVIPNSIIARENFKMNAPESHFYNFFESKEEYAFINSNNNEIIPWGRIIGEARNAIKPNYLFNPFENKYSFYFNAPLRKTHQLPFNEILAIYAVMFHLSSLVRYNPEYLEDLLSSSEMWLIRKFIQSTPLTFLRHMTNLIMDKGFVFEAR